MRGSGEGRGRHEGSAHVVLEGAGEPGEEALLKRLDERPDVARERAGGDAALGEEHGPLGEDVERDFLCEEGELLRGESGGGGAAVRRTKARSGGSGGAGGPSVTTGAHLGPEDLRDARGVEPVENLLRKGGGSQRPVSAEARAAQQTARQSTSAAPANPEASRGAGARLHVDELVGDHRHHVVRHLRRLGGDDALGPVAHGWQVSKTTHGPCKTASQQGARVT